jgi:hypothetical protein
MSWNITTTCSILSNSTAGVPYNHATLCYTHFIFGIILTAYTTVRGYWHNQIVFVLNQCTLPCLYVITSRNPYPTSPIAPRYPPDATDCWHLVNSVRKYEGYNQESAKSTK